MNYLYEIGGLYRLNDLYCGEHSLFKNKIVLLIAYERPERLIPEMDRAVFLVGDKIVKVYTENLYKFEKVL